MSASSTRGLDHPTRERIYRHLLLLPGDHFRSIARSLRIGVGTASYHLDVLVREGLVGLRRVQGRCRYYPTGKDAETRRNQLFMRHWSYRDLRLRVLLAVLRFPNVPVGVISRHLAISRQLASYHLARLVELTLVQREGRRYHALPHSTQLLLGIPWREGGGLQLQPELQTAGREASQSRLRSLSEAPPSPGLGRPDRSPRGNWEPAWGVGQGSLDRSLGPQRPGKVSK